MAESKLQFYFLICNKKKKKAFHELMTSYGAVCIDTIYGRGSAKAGTLAVSLGFEPEEHKAVISGLIPTDKALELTNVLMTKYNFKSSNTGIAFSIPVEGLSL